MQRWNTKEATRGGEEKRAFRGGVRARRDRETRGRGEEMEPPYLHGLDGLVGILHGAEIVVNGLVRQQQLVEDLQRPGPVANGFQRHDRNTSWDRGRIRRGGPDTLSPSLTHTFLHTLARSIFPPSLRCGRGLAVGNPGERRSRKCRWSGRGEEVCCGVEGGGR